MDTGIICQSLALRLDWILQDLCKARQDASEIRGTMWSAYCTRFWSDSDYGIRLISVIGSYQISVIGSDRFTAICSDHFPTLRIRVSVHNQDFDKYPMGTLSKSIGSHRNSYRISSVPDLWFVDLCSFIVCRLTIIMI
jgi:hypothetical protein